MMVLNLSRQLSNRFRTRPGTNKERSPFQRSAVGLFCVCWLFAAPASLAAQNGNVKPSGQPPTSGAATNAQNTSELPLPTRLPSGAVVESSLENELMTEEEETAFKRSKDIRTKAPIFEFQDALKSTSPTEKQRKAIARGVRWYVARFTMQKYRKGLTKLRQEILRMVQIYSRNPAPREVFLHELTNAAEEIIEPRKFEITHERKQNIVIKITEPTKDGKNQTRTVEAKDVDELQALRQKDPEAVELFEVYGDRTLYFGGAGGAQNLHVRLNAIVLLTELNIKSGNATKKIPPIPYDGVTSPLLRVMHDKDQLSAFRVPAVKGLARVCRHGELDRNDKRRPLIAKTFAGEINRPDAYWWYRWQLVEGLGSIGINDPIVAQTLTEQVANAKRHWLVRCGAARALGRATLDSTVNLDLIAFEIVNLGAQLAQAYNKQVGVVPWKNCALILYFAFKPINRLETTSDNRRTAGLVENSGSNKKIKEAYAQLLPVIKHVLKADPPAPVPGATLKSLADWLKTNQPNDFHVVPGGKPIATTAPALPKKQAVTGN